MTVSKPKAKISVVNRQHCSLFDDEFYVDVVENESGYTDHSFADGFQNTENWSESSMDVTCQAGTAKFLATSDGAGTATYAFNEEIIRNGDFEDQLEDWQYYTVNSEYKPYADTTDKHAGTYACNLCNKLATDSYYRVKSGVWQTTTKALTPDTVSLWYDTNGTTSESFNLLVRFFYKDGTYYSKILSKVSSWTEATQAGQLSTIVKDKPLTKIELKAVGYDSIIGLGDVISEDPIKKYATLIDDISIKGKTTIDTADAPFLSFKVLDFTLDSSGTFEIQIQRDSDSVWETAFSATGATLDTGTYFVNIPDVIASTKTYKGIRIEIDGVLNDYVSLEYILWRGFPDWTMDSTNTDGAWAASDLGSLEVKIDTDGDDLYINRGAPAGTSLGILVEETPYISIKYKADTDMDLFVDAYIDSAWSNNIFGDAKSSHTGDWEMHTYHVTSGTQIDGLRLRFKGYDQGGSWEYAQAFVDFIAIHSDEDDIDEFESEYVKDISVDKRDRRAESFSIRLANPDGLFKEKFNEGTQIGIFFKYDGGVWEKITEGFVTKRQQRLDTKNEEIVISGESRGSFARYNTLYDVWYGQVDFGEIVYDLITNYCVDQNGRRKIVPAEQFAYRTMQFGTFEWEETTVMEALEEVADTCGYELYIDASGRLHFYYNENAPYNRPDEYTETNITDIWSYHGSGGSITEETSIVKLGESSVKFYYPASSDYAEVIAKSEMAGLLNSVSFWCYCNNSTGDITLTFYDWNDNELGTATTTVNKMGAWEHKKIVFYSGYEGRLIGKIRIDPPWYVVSTIYFDGMYVGGTTPKERRYPFPYDGDRFTETDDRWHSTAGTITLSENAKVNNYSVKSTDTSTHQADIVSGEVGNAGEHFRINTDSSYNYVSFWLKGKTYTQAPDYFQIRLYSRYSSSHYYEKTSPVDVSDWDWTTWERYEINIGSEASGWTSTGSPTWESISGIRIYACNGSGTPVSYLDEMYIDGLEFFYEGISSETISLDSEKITGIDVARDIQQVVNRVKVTYDDGLSEITIEDTESQELYDLREKKYRKNHFDSVRATQFAHSILLTQAFPRYTADVSMVGNTDYEIGQFVTFDIDRMEFHKRGIITGIKHRFSSTKGWTTEVAVGSPQYERVIRELFEELRDVRKQIKPPQRDVKIIPFEDAGTAIWRSGDNLYFDDESNTPVTLTDLIGTPDFPATSDKWWYNEKAAVFSYSGVSEEIGRIYAEDAGSEKYLNIDLSSAATVFNVNLSSGAQFLINDSNPNDVLLIDDTGPLFRIGNTASFRLANNAIEDSSAATVIGFNGSGEVNKIGSHTGISTNDYLKWNGTIWTYDQPAGGVGGSGTAGTIAVWDTGGTDITDAMIREVSSNIYLEPIAAAPKVMAQPGDGNKSIAVEARPSGTSTQAIIRACNASSLSDYGYFQINVLGTDVNFDLNKIGGGTSPDTLYINPAALTAINLGASTCAVSIGGGAIATNTSGQVTALSHDTPSPGQVITWNASGYAMWDDPTGGVSGTGTQYKIPRWATTTSLEDSIMTEDNTNDFITIAGGSTQIVLSLQGGTETALTTMTGYLHIGDDSSQHLNMDTDEIQSKSNSTTAAQLNLNPHGGTVRVDTMIIDADSYVLGIYPAGSNLAGEMRIRPSGTNTQTFLSLYDAYDTTNAGVFQINFQGTTNSIVFVSGAAGSGTAPDTLSINDSDWGALNFGGEECAVSITGGVIATNASGQVTALSHDTPSGGQVATWNASGYVVWDDVTLPATVVETDQANTYTAGMKQTMGASSTTAGLSLAGYAGDPSGVSAGDIWYNTSTNRMKYRGASATREVVARTLSQTLTNKTINATNNTITDTSTAAGDILKSNGSKFTRLARGTENYVLKAGASDIAWGQVDFSELTGTLPAHTSTSHTGSIFPAAAQTLSHTLTVDYDSTGALHLKTAQNYYGFKYTNDTTNEYLVIGPNASDDWIIAHYDTAWRNFIEMNEGDYSVTIGGAGSLVTIDADLKVVGDDILDSAGNTVISFDGSGEIDKIGSHSGISSGDFLKWDGSKWTYDAPTGGWFLYAKDDTEKITTGTDQTLAEVFFAQDTGLSVQFDKIKVLVEAKVDAGTGTVYLYTDDDHAGGSPTQRDSASVTATSWGTVYDLEYTLVAGDYADGVHLIQINATKGTTNIEVRTIDIYAVMK